MIEGEKLKALVVEGYNLTLVVDKKDFIFTVCATCKKIIYSAPKIDSVTERVAESASVEHASSFSPGHDVVTVTLDLPH